RRGVAFSRASAARTRARNKNASATEENSFTLTCRSKWSRILWSFVVRGKFRLTARRVSMFGKGQSVNLRAPTLVVLSAMLMMTAYEAQAVTETVIYNFCSLGGTCPDGNGPYTGLTSDGQGNFYGTTVAGGNYGFGMVYELSPNGSGGYNETTLYSFCSA